MLGRAAQLFLAQEVASLSPFSLQVEPTTYCNLDCVICLRKSLVFQPNHLSQGAFKAILNTARPRWLELSGLGEPFLNPAFFDMIKYAKDSGLVVSTTTNASAVGRCAQDLVSSRLDLLKVSLDGASDTYYEKVRPGASFADVVKGLKTLQRVKAEVKSKKPNLQVRFVIIKENFSEIEKMPSLAKELGIDSVFFQFLEFSPLDTLRQALVKDLELPQLRLRFKNALFLARQLKIKTNILDILELFNRRPGFKSASSRRAGRCLLPWISAFLRVDGSVFPCCKFVFEGFGEKSLGNIFDSAFSEIWNGPPYRKLRRAFKDGQRPYRACRECPGVTYLDFLYNARVFLQRFAF